MGYCETDSVVRVDRFKERGKWYDTFAIDMAEEYHATSIHEGLRRCLAKRGISTQGYIFVCLEPYHEHSHPVMIKGMSE